MLCGPFGISSEGHHSLESQLVMVGYTRDEWDQTRQHNVLIWRYHATHSSDSELDPLLHEIIGLLKTLHDTHNLAAVLQHIAHLMTELTELFFLITIAFEQILLVTSFWLGKFEMADHNVH